jgi:PiT family inorganic phosphate transporter
VQILALLALVITLSLLYTYTNGFQDGSSVAAGPISCRALTRMQAVLLVTVCEFLGAIFGGSAVAYTIRSITSWPDDPALLPVLANGLFAAILWNYITKILKVPSSSTHALVGGIIGSIVAATGSWKYIIWGDPDHILQSTSIYKVVFSLFLSPLIGFFAGFICFFAVLLLLLRASSRANKGLKQMQWLTTAALAFGHGSNDTQKAMGVIVIALNASGVSAEHAIPLWVRLLVGTAMAFGILSLVPGIVRRVGGIYKMRPIHGFVSELSSAAVVLLGSATGAPVSASQIIASTVMGVGAAQRRKGVHWLIARDMLMAWFLTIPCSALLSAASHALIFHWISVAAFGR